MKDSLLDVRDIVEKLEFLPDETIFITDNKKRFVDIVPVIPSNVIIHKTIPGLGATYTEITADRNSVIVLPNVATIHNKHDRHAEDDNTFRVFESVSSRSIANYLTTGPQKKKILTTPEGLVKVCRAFKIAGVNGLKDYFILLDEAHKYIQDVDYRPNIVKAVDLFFCFANKSLISSTPIKPSDPRFSTFKCIKIQPTFDYHYPVELLFHNNIIFALKDSFERNPQVKQCIFFNSVNGIRDIITKLKLWDSAMIFCSEESSKSLADETSKEGKTFKSAYKFDKSLVCQYNFFTSSLFSGLDIELDEPPQVILISLPNDPKTYLDPYTDVVQILGRFRKTEKNPNGIFAEAIHLTAKWGLHQFRLKEEVTQWVIANQHVYDSIVGLMYSNINAQEKMVYKEALKRLPFHNLLADDSHLQKHMPSDTYNPQHEDTDIYKLNYFKLDNLYEEERVKSYYARPSFLVDAYEAAGVVTTQDRQVKSFEVYLNERVAPLKHQMKLNLMNGKRHSIENTKMIVNHLQNLENISGEHQIYDKEVSNSTPYHALVKRAYHVLGVEKIKELGYSISKIRQALIDYDVQHGKNQHPVIDSVHNKFILNVKIPVDKIKHELQIIYNHYNIPRKAKATDILHWFEIKDAKIVTFKKDKNKAIKTKVREEQRAYILLKRKFNDHYLLERS